jgi:hypothetical protein
MRTDEKHMKHCSKCGGVGPFGKNKYRPDGLQYWCKACRSEHAAAVYENDPEKLKKRVKKYLEDNPEKRLWTMAKTRATKRGIAFNIEVSDVVIPVACPLLGVLMNSGGRDTWPSLDRKNNALGYEKGNVWVISFKANRMKTNATTEELLTFAGSVLAHHAENLL